MTAIDTDPFQNGDGDPATGFPQASTMYEQAPVKTSGESDPEEPTEKKHEESPDEGDGEHGEEHLNRKHEEELKEKVEEVLDKDKGKSETGEEPKEKDHIPVTIEIDDDSSDDSDSDDDAQFMSLPPSPGPVNAAVGAEEVANTPAILPEYLVERLRSLNLGSDAEPAPARQRDGSRTPTQKTVTDSLDLMHSVQGMYRILDLIQEEGSGGLVDKVIISQDSLREFIESLRPGSYSSLTKVDFKGLDKVTIKPVGIYGNREEIVRFLLSIEAIDELIAQKLRRSEDGSSGVPGPVLRSGLYAVKPRGPAAPEEQIYVIYWPEATTWDDDAVSSVQRNRVTFLRYLTKVADQVVALVSSDCAKSIVWDEGGDLQDVIDASNADTDRLFTFEVEKTKEQEENMKIRPGFKISFDRMKTHMPPPGSTTDATAFKPRLLFGEAYQGFLTQCFSSPDEDIVSFSRFEIFQSYLADLLKSDSVSLSEELDDRTIEALFNLGLRDRWATEFETWHNARETLSRKLTDRLSQEKNKAFDQLQTDLPKMAAAIREMIVDKIMLLYPAFSREILGSKRSETSDVDIVAEGRLESLFSIYERMRKMFTDELQRAKLDHVSSDKFRRLKTLFIIAQVFLQHNRDLDEPTKQRLTRKILEAQTVKHAQEIIDSHARRHQLAASAERRSSLVGSAVKTVKTVTSAVGSFTGWSTSTTNTPSKESTIIKEASVLETMSDVQFISDMKNFDGLLGGAVAHITQIAQESLRKMIDSFVNKLSHQAYAIQKTDCTNRLEMESRSLGDQEKQRLRSWLISEINKKSPPDARVSVRIEQLDLPSLPRNPYVLTGWQSSRHEPMLICRIYPLKLAEDDQQKLQMDSKFIPNPMVETRNRLKFNLPIGYSIAHVQMFEKSKLLIILFDPAKNALIYSGDTVSIAINISEGKFRTKLNQDKLGEDVIFAFDESTRLLAVCSSSTLKLNVFVFDETFRLLQALINQADLYQWYRDYSHPVAISAACFVSGNQEIFLIDSHARARIYSFVTLQCRPATLQLPSIPTKVWSSPDGSCLLAMCIKDEATTLTAYHLSTFGASDGITANISDFPVEDIVLTSFVNRNNIHLISLDSSTHSCRSIALDITGNITEFMFKESGNRTSARHGGQSTVHNSVIDCHKDVWTRFPVQPAIERRTITSMSERQGKVLIFVTDEGHEPFPAYFSNMVRTFQRTTKKPTGRILEQLSILVTNFASLREQFASEVDWQISSLRAGEWLADLICLIPIHIAVCRENRFIPLKDGVFSAELERSLLGAEVTRIVDSLTFGWYESLFQSYMASKPVKVVSSMGEQSVGKSFALNHLADTSFAGSAMRTTEGVWLSCTPTDENLIVALDFEGVHSIERSAQEDTLLVLFNSAISNLVLFRNNFALSRDITGLFQSFQSSASILDPSANPNLFQSTLLIIIKDVVDSDKNEITREFSLKFRKIVHDEQDSNFISRLHAGKLNIIPWPVIESNEFYRLFNTLNRLLQKQSTTHHAAGEFSHTLKTLMAKLKANDWGALSHTMAAHRAQSLLGLLPKALQTGLMETGPPPEPLKNFDTDLFIEKPDSEARFSIPTLLESSDRDDALLTLCNNWDQASLRQQRVDSEWIRDLSSHLNHLADMRIDHVSEWISSNLARFQTSHASIEELRRTCSSASLELKTNVQICKATCDDCQLLCLRPRSHEGSHNCSTSHACIHECGFCAKESVFKFCGMSAGHPGKHVCVVNTHLCGEPCELSAKRGCLKECTKVLGHHEDEHHSCAARLHMCGEPCSLVEIQLPGGQLWSCQGTCSVPSDEDHTIHQCENRLCPVSCQLCKQLCNKTHLHGLLHDEKHLCGQAHSCNVFCGASGICQIETTPHSIEATFTGRHETFQYTKYTQVAKRLKCIRTIDPDATEHEGDHCHSGDKLPFHFCEARCENCGYYCTLPLGHVQQEHETSHGSMSQTRWAIDGPDGTSIELEGRKFASNDDGAPMMCNLVCSSQGRHAHIDYCRAEDPANCGSEDVEHISRQLLPNPDRKKDYITHGLLWRRTGFKDPYSREEQANFAKCDAMCPGPEHAATATTPAQPSYCTLPMFHATNGAPTALAGGAGHISTDGHHYNCQNPASMQPAFHVIFVIDRSSSMGMTDRRPLANTPARDRIIRHSDNRLGAVFSALHSFWMARQAAVAGNVRGSVGRRDAYSVVLFYNDVTTPIVNDFTSSPDQLLDEVLPHQAQFGTNFTMALECAQGVMETNWNTERNPVVIFLSDGECGLHDATMQDLCRSAMHLGKPLSFHAVSFGNDRWSRTLRRMVEIATEVQNQAPFDPLAPATASVPSSYADALDTVRLAQTFLNIAESLRKPRGSLLR